MYYDKDFNQNPSRNNHYENYPSKNNYYEKKNVNRINKKMQKVKNIQKNSRKESYCEIQNQYEKSSLNNEKFNKELNKQGGGLEKKYYLIIISFILIFYLVFINIIREKNQENNINDYIEKPNEKINTNDFQKNFCLELSDKIENTKIYEDDEKNEIKKYLKPIFQSCEFNIYFPKFSKKKSNTFSVRKFSKNHYYEYYVRNEKENYVNS